MEFSKLTFSVAVLSVLLTGCMTQQIANTRHMDDAVSKQAANSNQTPQQICETASLAIAKADKEDLHFYAPLHLEQASDNLQEGQEKIKVKETQAQGVAQCFKVKKLIENGVATKAKVKTSLKDSLAELNMLKKVDDEKKFTDDIQDHIEDVMDLVKEIEAGKMNEAMQGQAELLKEMLELEIEIVTDKNLTPVEAMLEKAEDVDADDLAEKTFEKAEAELESAKKFIRANYRNNEQVKNTSALAMRSAKHAFYVAKEVETLKELKPEAAEEKVLYIESLLERVNKKFNQEVVIGHSLYEQSTIISKRLDSIIDVRGELVREVAQLREQQQNKTTISELPPSPSIEAVTDEIKSDEVELGTNDKI
ncbi:MAG: hypothetical protein OQK72_08975 [Gammaproteobacteria bacterium]|nr:hypothetical protein [Gammaproteobacteria bacterium]